MDQLSREQISPRVALAGLGFMGQTHLAAWQRAGASVDLIFDRKADDPARLQAVEGNVGDGGSLDWKDARLSTRFEDLIEDPQIEVVDICLPTPKHAALSIAALEAGKHVLCEKPMALTLAECDAMLAAARQSGKFLMIGHCLRFWPQYVKAHELISRGELGGILYARLERAAGAPKWSKWLFDASKSGGAALDFHLHDADVALWWFGVPAEIEAATLARGDLNTQVDALWRYENGPVVVLHGGWDFSRDDYRMAFEVRGHLATIRFDSSRGEELELWRDGVKTSVEFAQESAYDAQIRYFAQCVREGKTPARARPQDARQAIELVLREISRR